MTSNYNQIIVHNLDYSENEKSIKSHFKSAGKIINIEIYKSSKSKSSRGIAKITFENPEEAKLAINKFHNTIFNNRKICVEFDVADEIQLIENIEEKLGGKMNKIVERLEKLESKIEERLENKFDIFDQKIDNIGKKVDEMHKVVGLLQERSNEQTFINKCICNPQSQLYYTNLIPIGKEWQVETVTKNTLQYDNVTYIVTVSDVDSNYIKSSYPYFLFNGKKENERGYRWATSSNQTDVFIIINFSEPRQANVLSMTSRNGKEFQQAPIRFEIYGSNTYNQGTCLLRKNGIIWKENTKLNFTFYNTESYLTYKIRFHESASPEKYFGLAELNLGLIS